MCSTYVCIAQLLIGSRRVYVTPSIVGRKPTYGNIRLATIRLFPLTCFNGEWHLVLSCGRQRSFNTAKGFFVTQMEQSDCILCTKLLVDAVFVNRQNKLDLQSDFIIVRILCIWKLFREHSCSFHYTHAISFDCYWNK